MINSDDEILKIFKLIKKNGKRENLFFFNLEIQKKWKHEKKILGRKKKIWKHDNCYQSVTKCYHRKCYHKCYHQNTPGFISKIDKHHTQNKCYQSVTKCYQVLPLSGPKHVLCFFWNPEKSVEIRKNPKESWEILNIIRIPKES